MACCLGPWSSRGSADGDDPMLLCRVLGCRGVSGFCLDAVLYFLFDLAYQVGVAVCLSGPAGSVPLLSNLLLLHRLPQVQLLIEHVLLVLQIELWVSVSDQVELPRQQEVVEMEVIRTQIQVFFT